MTRRSLFKTLLAAPLAALCFWRKKADLVSDIGTMVDFPITVDRSKMAKWPQWSANLANRPADEKEILKRMRVAMRKHTFNPPVPPKTIGTFFVTKDSMAAGPDMDWFVLGDDGVWRHKSDFP